MARKRNTRKKFYESNCYGTVEILEDQGKHAIVKFLNTGYEKKVHWANIPAGKMKDDSVKYTPPKIDLMEEGTNNAGEDFIIMWKQGKTCVVQFKETGSSREALIDNVRAGKVRDKYARSCYGRGYQGEVPNVPYKKQANQLWRNMLKRCYCEKDTRGYYGKGVSVDERWLCFANFVEDLPKLKNFDKWLNGHKEGQPKFNLDKDLKVEGNKVYSREMCDFVSEYENKSAGGINRQKLGWIRK